MSVPAVLVAGLLIFGASGPALAAGGGGHDMSQMDGGSSSSSAGSTGGTPKPIDGAEVKPEQHTGPHDSLPAGPREWKNPQTVAEAALVRVETWADVAVGLHHNNLYHYEFDDLHDPQAVGTGSYINSRGAVLTSRSALHDGKDQLKRFGVRAVNEAFVKHGMLPALPADPFAQVHLADPADDVYLQSCYNWEEPQGHCVVFVTPKLKVFPSISAPPADGFTGQPTSDPQVAVLTTPDQHKPLTLQFADPEKGEKFWAVASGGVNKPAKVVTGTLTGDIEDPVSGTDRDRLWDEFGAAGQGSPVVSSRGDVVGLINRTGGDHEFEVVGAQHLARDAKRFGIARDSSPTDTDFREGLRLYESQEYEAALPALDAVVADTAGQRVPAGLAGTAKKLAGTDADRTDEANAHQALGGSGLPWWVFVLIAVAVFAAALAAVVLLRRRRSGGRPQRVYAYHSPPDDGLAAAYPGAGYPGADPAAVYPGADPAAAYPGADPAWAAAPPGPSAAELFGPDPGAYPAADRTVAGPGYPVPADGPSSGEAEYVAPVSGDETVADVAAYLAAQRSHDTGGETVADGRIPVVRNDTDTVSVRFGGAGSVPGADGDAGGDADGDAGSDADGDADGGAGDGDRSVDLTGDEPGVDAAVAAADRDGAHSHDGQSHDGGAYDGHAPDGHAHDSVDVGEPVSVGGPGSGGSTAGAGIGGSGAASGATATVAAPAVPSVTTAAGLGAFAPRPSSTVSGTFCRQCGSHLSPGDRFCYACGNPVNPPS